MKGRNLQKDKTHLALLGKINARQNGQLRHEVFVLQNENENLRPLKTEMARLRAGLADWFYGASEET